MELHILKIKCDHCCNTFEVRCFMDPKHPEEYRECRCSHCGYRYVRLDGQWFDEVVEKFRKRDVENVKS